MFKFNFFDRFYSHNSCFVHGGVEKPGEEQPPVMGQAVRYLKIQVAITPKQTSVTHQTVKLNRILRKDFQAAGRCLYCVLKGHPSNGTRLFYWVPLH